MSVEDKDAEIARLNKVVEVMAKRMALANGDINTWPDIARKAREAALAPHD